MLSVGSKGSYPPPFGFPHPRVLLAVGGATMSGNLKTVDAVAFEAKH